LPAYDQLLEHGIVNPTASFLLFAYATASLAVDSLMNPYAGIAAVFAASLKMAGLWLGIRVPHPGSSLNRVKFTGDATMKHHCSRHQVLSACALASAMLLPSVVSADDSALPPIQRAGQISYISGGIGQDESTAMKAEAEKYPLSVTFTNHIDNRDAYASDVQVSIVKADSTPVFDVKSAGPLLLIDLPVGKYRVTAVSGENSKTLPVQIAAGSSSRLVFAWTGAGN
jgi:hypothetical protein